MFKARERQSWRPLHATYNSAGITLIELLAVVALIGLIGSLIAIRGDSLTFWRQNAQMRAIANTLQLLHLQARTRGEGYQLIIDLDSNEYFALREVPVEDENVKQVDYLRNLRIKSEQKRRDEQKLENLPSIDQEFQEEDRRQGGALDSLFYDFLYSDPSTHTRLAVPLEFPKLAQRQQLKAGVTFRNVKTLSGESTSGLATIRFSPSGGADFAMIYLLIQDSVFTLFMNPSTGEARIEKGEVEFEWDIEQDVTEN